MFGWKAIIRVLKGFFKGGGGTKYPGLIFQKWDLSSLKHCFLRPQWARSNANSAKKLGY